MCEGCENVSAFTVYVYFIVGDLDGCGRAVRLLVQVGATWCISAHVKRKDEAPRKHPAHGVVHLRKHTL
jgi:uncharacterized protein (UPF0261 family)